MARSNDHTDQEEFYQLLDYTDDVDLNHKLAECEKFYNPASEDPSVYVIEENKLC